MGWFEDHKGWLHLGIHRAVSEWKDLKGHGDDLCELYAPFGYLTCQINVPITDMATLFYIVRSSWRPEDMEVIRRTSALNSTRSSLVVPSIRKLEATFNHGFRDALGARASPLLFIMEGELRYDRLFMVLLWTSSCYYYISSKVAFSESKCTFTAQRLICIAHPGAQGRTLRILPAQRPLLLNCPGHRVS